ncbi:MAG TPA: CBS domain-containing protein [Vicinamibacterales bacterium]|nr:CBS domain-containing protein [Vicinamibacterales bacterium]
MTIGEVCTRDVVSVQPGESVLAVAQVMRHRHVGDVVVVEGDGLHRRPIGILTDRDIVVGIVAQAPERIAQLLVSDVFTRDILTVDAEDTVEAALDVMRDRGIRRLPVVEVDGRLKGIVTFDDLIGVMARHLADLAQVVGRERRREEHLRT